MEYKDSECPTKRTFGKCSSLTLKYKIFPFYKLQTDYVVYRREKETDFIKVFNPKVNRKSKEYKISR